MAASTETQSQLVRTAQAACLAYNTWDIEKIMSYRHQDSWTQVVPKSLGHPRLNNDGYRQFFASIQPLFKDFKVHINDIVEDAARHKVVLHCNSTATTVLGDYGNEYVIIIKTTDDDEKVLEFQEFVDTAYSNEYYAKMRAALAAKAASASAGDQDTR